MSSTSTIDQPPPDMATGYYHDKPGQPFQMRAEMHPDFSFGTGNPVSQPAINPALKISPLAIVSRQPSEPAEIPEVE